MPPRKRLRRAVSDDILETPDSSVLDVLDQLLNKGVMATGGVTLGVAGIDLIYVRLSALLCAADRVLSSDSQRPKRRRRR
jgi:gas vesicle protein GvpA/GvpJ/GvpM family